MPATDTYLRPSLDGIGGVSGAALNASSLYLMHLVSCALSGEKPMALCGGASWDAVFKLAGRNSVATTCAFAVTVAPGASDEERARWQAEVDRNLMRHVVFDMEREAIFSAMDKAGLAHLPLKGVVTSRQYPRPEMRWMCDNDILFGRVCDGGADGDDAPRVTVATDDDARELRSIMEAAGFKAEHFGMGNHDAYEKLPFLNFEMHRGLANPEVSWWEYYKNPWSRAQKDADAPGLAYAFSREDAYLFHIAHMFKHFSNSGHGVRGLADEWVLMQAWDAQMDRAYLDAELGKLGMLEFERDLRRTATAVVGQDACGRKLAGEKDALTADDAAMLAYMLGSGTYGTIANHVSNELAREAGEHGQKGSRARYLLGRAFPPLEKLEAGYPVLKKAPWLLPGVYVYRFVVKPFTRTDRLRAELSAVSKAGSGAGAGTGAGEKGER